MRYRQSVVVATLAVANGSSTTGPCYSARLIEPFLRVLGDAGQLDSVVLASLRPADPETRVPIGHAHELLELAVRWLKDPDLGLKAGQLMSTGDCGAVDYTISSAPTVRDAIDAAVRYTRLVNEVIAVSLEVDGRRALLRVDCDLPMPRAAADFMMAGFYNTHARAWLGSLTGLECWFRHPTPAALDGYRAAFGGARLRFAAPCHAFAFEQALLDTPLAGANPKLHSVVRRHAEQLLSQLPVSHSLTERVRQLLMGELSHGRLTAQQVAGQLRMSRRTLCRKLESEGTSFTALLADLRQRLALQYVGSHDLGLSEIAFLLGFSEAAAFHRAFKRWTGQTPLEYRRGARAS